MLASDSSEAVRTQYVRTNNNKDIPTIYLADGWLVADFDHLDMLVAQLILGCNHSQNHPLVDEPVSTHT